MASNWVNTATIKETIRTPNVAHKLPNILPIIVEQLYSPKPTEVIVITVIHIMLQYTE